MKTFATILSILASFSLSLAQGNVQPYTIVTVDTFATKSKLDEYPDKQHLPYNYLLESTMYPMAASYYAEVIYTGRERNKLMGDKHYSPRFYLQDNQLRLHSSVQLAGLQSMRMQVVLDTTQRTLTWSIYSLVDSTLDSTLTRNIKIQTAAPPLGYTIKIEQHSTARAADLLAYSQDYSTNRADILESWSDTASYFEGFRYSFVHFPPRSLFDLVKHKVDWQKEVFWSSCFGGDCSMRLENIPYFDAITNMYIIRVHNIWGGCAAGGQACTSAILTKPNTTFGVVIEAEHID